MFIRIGLTRKTLVAVGLAALALTLSGSMDFLPMASAPKVWAQERLAGSGGAPAAPEGPFAEDFTFSDPPVPAPSVAFQALEGGETSLADFRGKVVLVNFWATWCAPCVREMPSLERLHTALEGEGFAVLAVSEDRGGAGVVAPFLARLDLQRLPVFLDPRGELARAFALKGMPTSFVIDRRGRVVAGLVGPAAWDSAEAEAFMRHYLEQSPVQPAPEAAPQETRLSPASANTPG